VIRKAKALGLSEKLISLIEDPSSGNRILTFRDNRLTIE